MAASGTLTTLPSWRAALPGPNRGYAFHPDAGFVVLADRTVLRLTDGWIPFEAGLLHRDSGFFIGPAGGLSMTTDRSRDARMDLAGEQMNAEDLGFWLGRRGIVADPQLARGWVARTDDGLSPAWRWNSEPGVMPASIPSGLSLGEASGENLRCLLDSLRQLLQRMLPEDQRGQVSADSLAEWLKRALPTGLQGYNQIVNRQEIDVTDVLPTFTEAFGVRVQVFEFRRRGETTANGAFTFTRDGIYVHTEVGPQHDEAGYPTPILHVHWRPNHFEPLYTDRYPVQLVLRQPLRDAGRSDRVAAVLPQRDQYEQVVTEIWDRLGNLPDRTGFLATNVDFEQRVNYLNQQWQTCTHSSSPATPSSGLKI